MVSTHIDRRFCSRPIVAVVRIWKNGQLVYDLWKVNRAVNRAWFAIRRRYYPPLPLEIRIADRLFHLFLRLADLCTAWLVAAGRRHGYRGK